MSSRRSIARVVLFALFVLTTVPLFAEEEKGEGGGDPVAVGLKFALEKSVGKLAEMGYKTNCKGDKLNFKTDENWYCGVFGSLSGQDKKDYEKAVADNLLVIRGQLKNIENGLTKIQEQQARIYNANEQILVRLNEIAPEGIIGKGVSRIRTMWEDQFVPSFDGTREFEKGRLLAFANQVVFTDRLDKYLGDINDQVTRSLFGNETLLRSYAKRMKLQAVGKGDKSLDPQYEYLESSLDGLLAEERKGYAMYIWAVETLETNCEVTKQCVQLPHTSREYQAVFDKYIQAQLGELNAALEWEVLAWSDAHSRSANFLHPDAARLFARADLFTAGNLGKFGLVGRVISMGDDYNGRVRVGDGTEMLTPAYVNSVSVDGAMLDWWTTPEAAPPFTFDTVRFTDKWKIYHYQDAARGNGAYSVMTWMPYRPDKVTVGATKISDTRSETFGSFVAIQRAGGGYAFLHGDWNESRYAPSPTVKGEWHAGSDDAFFNAGELRAGIRYSGRIEWKFKNTGDDQHIETKRTDYAVSKKKIRYDGTGELTLNADFADTLPIICPGGACSDYDPYSVLIRYTDFKKGGVDSRSGKLDTRTVLLLNGNEEGKNGIVWERSGGFDGNLSERYQSGNHSSAKVTMSRDNPVPIVFGGQVDVNLQTSTLADSSLHVVALMKLANAYLSK